MQLWQYWYCWVLEYLAHSPWLFSMDPPLDVEWCLITSTMGVCKQIQSELHPKMHPVIWKWFPLTLSILTIKVNCNPWDPLSLGQLFIIGYSRKISCFSSWKWLKNHKNTTVKAMQMQLSVQRCSQDSSMFSRGLYCMSIERLSH